LRRRALQPLRGRDRVPPAPQPRVLRRPVRVHSARLRLASVQRQRQRRHGHLRRVRLVRDEGRGVSTQYGGGHLRARVPRARGQPEAPLRLGAVQRHPSPCAVRARLRGEAPCLRKRFQGWDRQKWLQAQVRALPSAHSRPRSNCAAACPPLAARASHAAPTRSLACRRRAASPHRIPPPPPTVLPTVPPTVASPIPRRRAHRGSSSRAATARA
jgi:hypothetical protein